MKEEAIEIPPFIKAEYLEGGDPMPRTLYRFAEILDFLYKLADHPFLGQWKDFVDVNPFNVQKLSEEYHQTFNRTIIERTISDSFHYAKIHFDNNLAVLSSKTYEISLGDIEIMVTVMNGNLKLPEKDLSAQYGVIHGFRIRLSAVLHMALLSFCNGCMDLIILHWRDLIKQNIKKLSKEEVREYVLRQRKELRQKEPWTTPKIYKEMMEYLDAELELYNSIQDTDDMKELKEVLREQVNSRKGILTSSKALQCLAASDLEGFIVCIKEFVLSSYSMFDLAAKEIEQLYHVLLIAILSRLDQAYTIKSNHEAGFGRYDIALIPIIKDLFPLLFELKSIPDSKQSTIDKYLAKALQQIVETKYSTIFKEAGFKQYVAIGVVFFGKNVEMRTRIFDIP